MPQSVTFSMYFAQDCVSYVQKRQKENITSMDIDRSTRLGAVFLMFFSTWTLGSSYAEFPLEGILMLR